MKRVLAYSREAHWTLSTLKPRVAAVLAILCALAITLVSFLGPANLNFSNAFAIPIFLCAWTRSRRFLWAMAIYSVAVIVARVIAGPLPQPLPNPVYFYLNRVLNILTVVACAGVTHMLIGLILAMEARAGQLENHNAELAAREEKIAAQNQELKNLFDSIETERQRLKTIVGTVPVGVSIADAAANTIVYNPAAAQMLGVEPDRAYDLAEMQQRFAGSEIGAPQERYRHGIVRAMAGERVAGAERDFDFPDGRKLNVLVSAEPMRDRNGNITGAVAAFVDITQQKQLQIALERQRREAEESSLRKSRFLAAVSHDIRTPANAINLLAELLQRTTPDDPAEITGIARDLKSSALSLVRLVSDVLDLTRFDAGRVELAETQFSLSQFIQDESRPFLPQARDKGVGFISKPPEPDIVVRTDRVKLSRVISNLIGNAVKFTRSGSITVDVGRLDDGYVKLSVADTGPGIPPEHHQAIFDEYFQLKNPHREHESGSGLGLAISRRLAFALGASLTVDSVVGTGATFTLLLPPSCVVRSGPQTLSA